MQTLKNKLRNVKIRRLLGTHVSLSDHRICEILGYIGFDYLWIDTEHTSTDYKELEMHLIAAKAAGVPAVVRIPWNEVPLVKRVLEMGPDGIVFPMINSYEEAKKAIDMCIYPPEGNRGFGPLRAVRYGIDDINTYIEKTSKEMCRFLQIESKQAVETMEEIAKVPYIDGFIIGPMDLSGSIGQLGKIYSNETTGLIRYAIDKSHNLGIPIGTSIGSDEIDDLKYWFDLGFDFISAGSDIVSIIKGARRLLENSSKLL